MAEADSGLLGRLALERGLVTPAQLGEALKEHERRSAAGPALALGELMVQMGLITAGQLEVLRSAQATGKPQAQPIEGFELVRKLGEGGMGATYLARQTSMDRLVALKILRKNLAKNAGFVERFQREARVAGRLDHVNLVRALDVGESGGFHYLAMEYVEGASLHRRMAASGALEEAQALHIALQVARALDYAHRHGVIHRDIKPDNILLDARNVAKLCDFGLAKQTEAETHLTQTGVMVGTPHYVSPEQARGDKDVDIRADIYSLGATLYHMATGRTPFSGSSAAVVMTKHLTEQVPWPQEANPRVSEHCCELIARMMAKDPADRYQTPAELIADLELVIDGKAPASRVLSPGLSTVARRGELPARPGAGWSQAGRARSGAATGRTQPLEPPVGARRLPLPALVGAGALLLVLLGTALWALTRGGGDRPEPKPPGKLVTPLPPPPPPPPTDDKRFEDMFQYADAYWKKNPDDFAGAASKFRTVREAAGGTVWAMKAADTVKEIDKAQAGAAQAAFAPLEAQAGKLAGAGDFEAALAVLQKPPQKLAELLAPRLKQAQEAIQKQAEDRLRAALEEAERLSKDGEPDKALARLQEVAGVKYAAWAPKIEELRKRLGEERKNLAALDEKRQKARAEKLLAATLDGLDERLLAGRFQEAAAFLAGEKARLGAELLPLVAGEFGAAEKVAGELSGQEAGRAAALKALAGKEAVLNTRAGVHKVTIQAVAADGFDVERWYSVGGERKKAEYRIKFAELAPGELERLLPAYQPRDAHGQVALALLAAGRKDYPAAEKALAAAGDHPLAGRYARKLELLKLGAVELAAKDAWEAAVTPLTKDKYALEEAKALLAALDAFAAAHGPTRFGVEKKPEIERLRALALTAIEESPEGMIAKVRKLWRGKVVKFDPKTLAIELLYDFEAADQLADWELSEFAAGGKTDRAMKIEAGRLHLVNTGRCALLAGLFRSAAISTDFSAVSGPGPGNVTLVVCADSSGNYYNLFGLQESRNSYMERYAAGKWYALTANKPSPAAEARGGSMTLSYADGRLRGQVGGLVLEAQDKTYPYGRVGLWAFDTHAVYDNIRVAGQLDRAWLEAELKRLAAREMPPLALRAEWKKMNGRHPAGGYAAAAFDSKRGWYLTASGSFAVWAYSVAADRWEEQAKSPKGDNQTFPSGACNFTMAYDPDRDGLVADAGGDTGPKTMRATIIFDCRARQWSVLAAKSGGWHDALACGGGALLRYNGKELLSFNRATGDWEALPAKAPRERGMPGERVLTYDPARKRFFLFGGGYGEKLNDTWTFDPAAGAWSELKPAVSPPSRMHPGVCYDAGNDLILMHGGNHYNKSTDTWVYDAKRNTWLEITPAETPPAGTGYTEYDPVNKCAIAWNHVSGEVWVLRIAPVERK